MKIILNYFWNSSSSSSNSSNDMNINDYIETFYEVSKWLNVILISLVTLLGLYGNLVSILIFSDKSYNKNAIRSLRVFLILLSTSDLLVLIFHYLDFTFRSWVNLTGAHSTRFNFVDKSVLACKLVPYMRNVFRTVSIFTLVYMTMQRFILIYLPAVQARLNSSLVTRILTLSLLAVSAAFNSVTAIVNDLDEHMVHGETYCSIAPNYVAVQFRFDLIFALVTILLPAVLIVVLGVILHRKIHVRYLQIKRNPSHYVGDGSGDEASGLDSNGDHENEDNLAVAAALKKQEEEVLDKSKRLSDYLNYVNIKFPQMPNMENLKSVDIRVMQKTVSNLHASSNVNNASATTNSNRKSYASPSHRHHGSNGSGVGEKRSSNRSNKSNQWVTICINRSAQPPPSPPSMPEELRLRRNLKHLKQSIKTTYMLLIVSKWFLLLHLPYFVCWCVYYLHMNKLINGNVPFTEYEIKKKILLKSFLQIFEILFLCNYAINFWLYMFYGSLFRKTHSKLLFKLIQNAFYYLSLCFYKIRR